MYKICLNIADILIEMESPLSPKELGIEERYASFFGAPANPYAHVFLRWEEGEETPKGELLFDPGSIWKMFWDGKNFYAVLHYNNRKSRSVLVADKEWENLVLREKRSGAKWQSLLDIGAGELILRAKMPRTGGLVFHSAGVDFEGKGVLIVGHAGEGKSTIAGIFEREPGAIVLSDDRIAVRVLGKKAVIYGTPWGGTAEIARNHSVVLKAIVLLNKAEENEIREISLSQSAPMLLARCFIPYWDQHLTQLALDTLHKLVQLVPVYLLRCRPEREGANLIKSIL